MFLLIKNKMKMLERMQKNFQGVSWLEDGYVIAKYISVLFKCNHPHLINMCIVRVNRSNFHPALLFISLK